MDDVTPQQIRVNYKTFVVTVREAGKPKPVQLATVLGDGSLKWEEGTTKATQQVRDATAEFLDDLDL